MWCALNILMKNEAFIDRTTMLETMLAAFKVGLSHESHVPSPGSQYLNPKLSLVHPTFSLKRLVFYFLPDYGRPHFPRWFLSWYFGSILRLSLGLYGAFCIEGALGKKNFPHGILPSAWFLVLGLGACTGHLQMMALSYSISDPALQRREELWT